MLRGSLDFLVIAAVLMAHWIMLAPAQRGPTEKGEKKGGEKKGPDKKGAQFETFDDHLARLRRQLEYSPSDAERQILLTQSRFYADRAEQIQRSGFVYIADRTLTAAESLLHASDHLGHLLESRGPPPPSAEIARNLAHVYFRTREAEYFFQEIHDNSAAPLVAGARQYYQRAIQSYDRSDFRAADEYGKTAEELVNTLENLAQAATLAPEQRPH